MKRFIIGFIIVVVVVFGLTLLGEQSKSSLLSRLSPYSQLAQTEPATTDVVQAPAGVLPDSSPGGEDILTTFIEEKEDIEGLLGQIKIKLGRCSYRQPGSASDCRPLVAPSVNQITSWFGCTVSNPKVYNEDCVSWLQEIIGAGPDGLFGSQTVIALNKFLNKMNAAAEEKLEEGGSEIFCHSFGGETYCYQPGTGFVLTSLQDLSAIFTPPVFDRCAFLKGLLEKARQALEPEESVIAYLNSLLQEYCSQECPPPDSPEYPGPEWCLQ